MKKQYTIGLVISLVGFGIFTYWANSGETTEELQPTKQYEWWAFMIGGISAISLPLGAMAGIIFKPRAKITASLTAFGAGALLAALSIELIAPTVMEIVGQSESNFAGSDGSKSHAIFTMGSLLIGCISGGLLFVILDEAINSKGGFTRKISTIITYVKKHRPGGMPADMLQNGNVMKVAEVHDEARENSGAPMAIWLGLLIDGIPESFVIGAGFLGLLAAKLTHGVEPIFSEVLPYTLIAGLFLSNFPEALSSSLGMKQQGMSTFKILMMWFSLVILVALGSLIGYFIGAEVPHEIAIGIEGLAAGAMLTMIAQTMLPEAVHLGGTKVVGLSTLIGYLSAVAFKLFE